MSEEITLDEFADSEKMNEEESEELFGLGQMPSDWDIKSLSDTAEIIPGNSPPSSTYNENGDGLPFFQGNSNFTHFHPEADTWCSDPRKEAQPNDVLISIRAPVGDLNISDTKCCIGRGLAAIRPKNLNGLYLYYNLGERNIWLSRLATGSTFKAINKSDLQLLDVPTPLLPEQRKIATALYTVDRAIEKTDEVITQTERLREGAMQDIFSRGVRSYDDFQETKYGTIPDNWELKPVREIADRIGSGGTPNTDKEKYYDGDIEWVKTDDLNGGLVESAKTTITSQGLDESAAKLFPVGTVVFAMYGGALGQNGRLGMEAAMNQACCGIVTDESEMNSYLLHQQLIHRKKQLTALSAGTHQQNISQSMIEKFEVFVPPLDEQKEVVDILKSIERTIEANTNEKERLKRLKQALMQDLLSGTVRTTDTNIEVPDEIEQYG